MSQKPKNGLPEIGYVYHDPKLDHPTEKFRLDIFVSSIPTEKHFDVTHVSFLSKSKKSEIEHLTITHPAKFTKKARICAGFVIMEDRKGKKEEVFTFGGDLQVEAKVLQTFCKFVSSAPILEITHADPLDRLFIEEIQILLAEERAAHPDHEVFEAKLCEADPFDLYLACLDKMIIKFEQTSHEGEIYHRLITFLHSQKHRLDEADLLKKPTPRFEDLFEE